MTGWHAVWAAGALGLAIGLRWLCRCRHEPMRQVRRDANGRPVKPPTIDWVCFRCGCRLGSLQVLPKFRLLAQIYRDRRKQRVA